MRRHFHEHPEADPAEQVKTLKTVASELDAMGIRNVPVPGGGLFGFIDGPAYGKAVHLRADTDALPIQEDPNNLKGPRVCVSRGGEEGFLNVEKLCGYIQEEGLSVDTCYSTHVYDSFFSPFSFNCS